MTESKTEFTPMRTSSPERWLYHFTTLSTALEKILTSQSIRMGQLGQMNDPKESRLDGFFVQTKNGLDRLKYQDFVASLKKYLQQHIKVFCATEDTMSAKDLESNTSQQACFKPAMWAHYGENHRGVCLVFDRDKLQKAFSSNLASQAEYYYFGSVEYLNAHKLFDKSYGIRVDSIDPSQQNVAEIAMDHFSNKYRELFFRKHVDWQHEFECGAMALSSETGPMDIPYVDSLAAVVVSMEFSPVYFDLLRYLAWQNNAGAYKTNWSVASWGTTNLMEVPVHYEPSETQRFFAEIKRAEIDNDA